MKITIDSSTLVHKDDLYYYVNINGKKKYLQSGNSNSERVDNLFLRHIASFYRCRDVALWWFQHDRLIRLKQLYNNVPL